MGKQVTWNVTKGVKIKSFYFLFFWRWMKQRLRLWFFFSGVEMNPWQTWGGRERKKSRWAWVMLTFISALTLMYTTKWETKTDCSSSFFFFVVVVVLPPLLRLLRYALASDKFCFWRIGDAFLVRKGTETEIGNQNATAAWYI